MSKRDWIKHPAFGVIGLIALSAALQYGNEYWSGKASGYAQEQAQKKDAHSAPIVSASDVPASPSYADADGDKGEDIGENANKPNWTDVLDLIAQWTMAGATLAIVGFTWLGLRVLRKTLSETETAAKHTEETLREAKKTTRAAFDSNEIALDVAKTQFGGMLVAQEARVKYDVGDESIHFEVKVENIGDTPVYNVRYGAICKIEEGSHGLIGVNDFVWPSFTLKALAPGDSEWATVYHSDRDQAAIAKALPFRKWLKVWGAVSWTGVSRLRNAYLFAFNTQTSIEAHDFKEMYRNPWGNTLARKEDLHRY